MTTDVLVETVILQVLSEADSLHDAKTVLGKTYAENRPGESNTVNDYSVQNIKRA